VDQEEVERADVEVRERPVERLARVIRLVEAVVQLAGHEDLVAGQAGGADRLADALLVAVHLGGVEVPVADVQRLGHRLQGVLRRHLEDAEPELRDGRAVIQGQGGNRVCHTSRNGRGPPIFRPSSVRR